MAFSPLDSELLGPLFSTDAMRGVFSDRARLAAMLEAEVALARAQARFGIVPAALGDALAAIDPGSLDIAALGRATAVAGVPTVPFVKAVQRQLPPQLEAGFHKGATTQDILDTALVLQMRRGLALLTTDALAIIAGLSRLAQVHKRTPCVGRTYGQHAAPITFGYKVAVWCAGIAEVADQLPALQSRILAASLGGPVGTLTGLGARGPAVAAAFAEELALAAAPISWHARRSRMVEAGVWLAMLIGALAKMATDIVTLASTEVREVAEPPIPGRGGSSAMPHKRNPVAATVILAAQGAAKGHVVTLLDAMAAAHERPAGAWHAEWHSLPQLFGLASGALQEGRRLAEGLVVDAERMRVDLDATRGLIFADAVAARLAPHLGREAAHALVEDAAERVHTTGGSLREVLAANAAIGSLGAGGDVEAAFDITPAVDAAAAWVDLADAEVRQLIDRLSAARSGGDSASRS
ncbi:MAG: adenylosuccinate lyase family protein [Xanthobacteraceae bacterium]